MADDAPVRIELSVAPSAAPFDAAAAHISAVTVFSDARAQVTRLFPRAALPAGRTVLVALKGLPGSDVLDAASVRVDGSVVDPKGASAAVLDVVWQESRGTEAPTGELEAELERELDALDAKKAALDAVDARLRFVDRYGDAALNQASAAAKDGQAPSNLLAKTSLGAIGDFLAAHASHSAGLSAERIQRARELKEQQTKVHALQENLARRLRGSAALGAKLEGEIGVLVRTGDLPATGSDKPAEVAVALTVTYVVRNCSWTPSYDVRVDSTKQTAELAYRAKVVNRTGEPWRNVELSLSTSRPTTASNPPSKPSQPWRLGIRQKAHYYAQRKSSGMLASIGGVASAAPPFRGARADEESGTFDGVFPQSVPMLEPTASLGTKTATGSSVFLIPGRPTVEDDGAEHAVTIARIAPGEGLGVKFEYSAYIRAQGPAGDNAWAEARLTNGTEWELLEGPAGIFVDGAFVARVPIPATPPSDSFALPLGPDPSLRLVRRPAHRTRDQSTGLGSLLGGRSAVRVSERAVLKNAKDRAAKVTVVDQVPLSQDDRVRVVLSEPAGVGEAIRKGDKEGKSKVQLQSFALGESDRRTSGTGAVEAAVRWTRDAGVLEWEVEVPAGKEVLLWTGYEVSWPAGEDVEGL
ncbi:hypothetical protein DFJ74DRAFT_701230 [Hyaloraphidium curvatum]|nr:hypothetical protein DFJ74DRAFT_701230 [Hyaloraphidium curvatum]